MSRWNFSVEQEGMVVASGDAPTEAEAKREAGHYAMMYAQDGPVKVSVKEVQGTPTLPREGKAQGMIIPLTSQSCSTCGHDRSWHIEDGSCQFTSETGIKCRVHCCQYSENGKAQDDPFPYGFPTSETPPGTEIYIPVPAPSDPDGMGKYDGSGNFYVENYSNFKGWDVPKIPQEIYDFQKIMADTEILTGVPSSAFEGRENRIFDGILRMEESKHGVKAGGAAGEDRRTVEAVSKGDDGVESGAVGVGEQKGVDG